MPKTTESSAIIRFIRAQESPIVDSEHGIGTQVVRNPYRAEKASRLGYVVGAAVIAAGIAVAVLVFSGRGGQGDATRAPVAAHVPETPEPVVTPAAEPEVEPVPPERPPAEPVVVAMPDDGEVDGVDAVDEVRAELEAELEAAGADEPFVDIDADPDPDPEARKTPRLMRRRAQVDSPRRAQRKGVLMVASKPPCRIFINGRDTGLTTPQKSIRLKAGDHRITLINREYDLRDSLSVTIQRGKEVRVIRDLTGEMK